ncbi:phage integrase N-terminal SAM-like domain-containing protein [uncultured Desulfobacter sp.]|uniref:phage integrase N-terminal SAM-like domain-containing protein n=1 Tax=uncultured Desulfobacter sp. TaxID=240139 RepID=UPI002AAACDDB|nr:phage integrase N-terminal SAM-like domain-containing protein [uncultured Desulfobacter sp.]
MPTGFTQALKEAARAAENLKAEQLEAYFADLVESHSWSTVKIDRLGLQNFWKFVLQKEWSG